MESTERLKKKGQLAVTLPFNGKVFFKNVIFLYLFDREYAQVGRGVGVGEREREGKKS